MKNQASLVIKSELIDNLLRNRQYDLLISELPFLGCKRLADLVAISNNTTLAFEIKSEKDSLQYLAEQLADYTQAFNLVYIVIAEKFYRNKQVKNLSKAIGIIVISSNGKLSIKRKAIPRKKLNKRALLSFIWKKDLIKLSASSKKAEPNKLKAFIVKKYSIATIQQEAIRALLHRYRDSYHMFLQDRGQYTSIEDLHTITGLKKPPVV